VTKCKKRKKVFSSVAKILRYNVVLVPGKQRHTSLYLRICAKESVGDAIN